MTEVRIDTSVFRGMLPPVCARCGVPTDRCLERTFIWFPRWVWVFLFAGPVGFVLAAWVFGKRRTLRLPVCWDHVDPWLACNLCAGASLACQGILGLVVWMHLVVGIIYLPPEGYLLGGLLLVVLSYAADLLHRTTIRIVHITGSDIYLRGVSDAFAKAVAEEESYLNRQPPDDPEDDARTSWNGTTPAGASLSNHCREAEEEEPPSCQTVASTPARPATTGWAFRYAASLRQLETARRRARRLFDEEFDYDGAAEVLESLPNHLRDNHLLREARLRRDRVAWLDRELRMAATQLRRRGLRPLVEELVTLVPKRTDLLPLLAELPPYEPGDVLLNSVGMRLALLPAGTFLMGSPDSDPSRYADEQPQRRVTLPRPFFLGIHPVTQAQFDRVLNRSPSYWNGPDRPVERVSWHDAVEFCGRLSEQPAERKAGRVYRLPTEAEWEYACRAGTTSRYPFDGDENHLDEHAWFDRNSGKETHEVGTLRPNAWGLYDTLGNVWEWCADWYGEYAAADGPVSDPTGATEGESRVLRGGSWRSNAWTCRAAHRHSSPPAASSPGVGFRVVLAEAPDEAIPES
jgi:formylglycine-generating enzyme required for sulfatase activity